MAERACEECGKIFAPRKGGKPQRFCSRACFSKKYYRHPDDTRETPKDAICLVCGTPFLKKKRTQAYCSSECQSRAWHLQHPDKNAEKARRRYHEKPEWYQARAPEYYRRGRAKRESSCPWSYLLQSARGRAKEKGIPFDLTNEWACARWTGKCEMTSLPFRSTGRSGPNPYAPSIDRIDRTKGYTQDNARFILFGVNTLKGCGTDSDVAEIARAIVASLP